MSSYYVDIHVIQSVPPSNVNRDDTGSPKSALYGGVRRARVSSQAWKKAVRTSFKEFLPANQTGSRTLRVVELLMNRLTAAPYGLPEEDARRRLSRSSRRSDSRPRNLVRRTSREPRESNARSTWSFTRTSNSIGWHSSPQQPTARSPQPTLKKQPIPTMGSRWRCSGAWWQIQRISTSTRPCRSPTR